MERRKWIQNLFKGRAKSQDMYVAETMSGYTPQFSAFGNNVNLSDLVIESIRLKADFCSKLDPRYIKTENGIRRTINDHTISHILKNPNPYMTTSDFLYKACFLREVNENVFIFPDYYMTVGGEKRYTGLYILQPASWKYYEYSDGSLAVGFKFNGKSDEVVFEYGDLIHWRKHYEFDDYDGGGKSTKNGEADLLNTLQAYRTICESIAEASKCACFFDGILKVNAFGQTDEKVKQIRDTFVNDLRNGKTGVGVLDNGAEWQDIKRNLAFVDEKTMSHFTDKILMHTGVSLAMLKGDFTVAQKEAFYERCIESGVISLGQAMTKCFFSQWQQTNGSEIILYPNKIDLMSTAEKTALIGATNAMGVWSINEIREMYGKPPVEGGDARPRGYNNLDGASATPTATPTGEGNKLSKEDEQDLMDDVDTVVKQPLLVGQLQSLSQIIADYQAGKYTYNQAVNMLIIGVGLTQDEAEKLLDKQDDNPAPAGE